MIVKKDLGKVLDGWWVGELGNIITNTNTLACSEPEPKERSCFHSPKEKTQRDFTRFQKKLSKCWGKVCLFIDNAPGHHTKIVDKFLADHKKTFHIEYFPKYCPQLNPVEPC